MTGMVPFNKRNSGLTGFDDFYNMLDDFFGDSWLSRTFPRGAFKVDVQENKNEYLIEAELPGIDKDQIDLQMNDGRLTISVNREDHVNEENKNYIHRERRVSSMTRSIYLPDAKADGVRARMDNGVLNIAVLKQENAAPRTNRIEIQ